MKRAPLATAAALLMLIGLTGCAVSGAESAPEPSSTPEATPSATAEAEPTALKMCEVMGEKFLEYPDYVLALLDGDTTDHSEYVEWANRLTDSAPADARTIVAKFTDPVFQVESVMQAGVGELTLTTTDYKAGTLEIMEYCVDAGYRVDQ